MTNKLLVCLVVCCFAAVDAVRSLEDVGMLSAGQTFCNVFELKTQHGEIDGDAITQYGVNIAFEMGGNSQCSVAKCNFFHLKDKWDEIFSTRPAGGHCECSLKESGAIIFSQRQRDRSESCDGNWCWRQYSSLRWLIMQKTSKPAAGNNDIQSGNHYCGGTSEKNRCACASQGVTIMPPLAELASDSSLTDKEKRTVKNMLAKEGVIFTEDVAEECADVSGTYTYKFDPPSVRTMFVTQTEDCHISIASPGASPAIQGGPVIGHETIKSIAGGPVSILDSKLKFDTEDGLWVRQAPEDCKDLAMIWKSYESRAYFAKKGFDSQNCAAAEALFQAGFQGNIPSAVSLGMKSCQATIVLKQAFADREAEHERLVQEKSTLSMTVSAMEAKYNTIQEEEGGRLCSFTEKEQHFQWGVSLAVPLKVSCKSNQHCNPFHFNAGIEKLFKGSSLTHGKCDCSFLGTYLLTLPRGKVCDSKTCFLFYKDIRNTLQRSEDTCEKGEPKRPNNQCRQVGTGQELHKPDHWDAKCDKAGVTTLPVSKHFADLVKAAKGGTSSKVDDEVDKEEEEEDGHFSDYGGSAIEEDGIPDEAVDSQSEGQKKDCTDIVAKLEMAKAELGEEREVRKDLRVKLEGLKVAIEQGGLKKQIKDLKKQQVKLEATLNAMGEYKW